MNRVKYTLQSIETFFSWIFNFYRIITPRIFYYYTSNLQYIVNENINYKVIIINN